MHICLVCPPGDIREHEYVSAESMTHGQCDARCCPSQPENITTFVR